MNKTSHIEFDVAAVFGRAVIAAIRAALTRTHGSAFADAFVADHIAAIHRATKARLNGRMDDQVRMELRELQRMNHGPASYD